MQARSGIMSVTGEEEGSPGQGRGGLDRCDDWYERGQLDTGMSAQTREDREGARIDISLWDTALASLVNQGHNALVGMKTRRMGSSHPNLVPYRVFQVSDGWFAIGVGTSGQWEKLVEALSLDPLNHGSRIA